MHPAIATRLSTRFYTVKSQDYTLAIYVYRPVLHVSLGFKSHWHGYMGWDFLSI